MARAVEKYLQRHVEPEARLADQIVAEYRHVLVVPAYREHPTLVEGYRGAAARAHGRVLCIVVVNARSTDPPVAIEETEGLYGALGRGGRALEVPNGLAGARWIDTGELDLLVIDRTSAGRRFGEKDGVGLARKIGADVATALWSEGRGARLIRFTDADVILPPDYFEGSERITGCAAVLFPFWHAPSGDERLDEATALYEIALRYYVAGLAWAGSPYAFHTIGSALAVDVAAYAAARGVPRLRAAEDFYLLNKLAKIGPVARAECAPIRIASRASRRVPFGTGARVSAMLDAGNGLAFYSPRCFEVLGMGLKALRAFARDGDVDRFREAWRGHEAGATVLGTLSRFGAPEALSRLARQHPRGPVLTAKLHEWFDAFRTLKLIHAVRDAHYPSVAFSEAAETAPFCASIRDGARRGAFDDVRRVMLEEESSTARASALTADG